MRRGEERQDEGVRVPEDVTAVPGPAQPACSDRGLAGVGRRRHEMEQREPHCQLELFVPLDDDIGVLPALCPRPPVLCQQTVEADLGDPPERVDRRGQIGTGVRIGAVGGHPVDDSSSDTGLVTGGSTGVPGLNRRRGDATGGGGGIDPADRAGPARPGEWGTLGRAERWAGPQSPRALGPEHRGGRAGEREEADAVDGVGAGAGLFVEDPGPQVEDPPHRRRAVPPPELEDDRATRQTGPGARAVVDAGGDRPGTPLRLAQQG